MARKRMVTRTIEANKVTVLCLDTVTAEPQSKTIEIPAHIKKEKKKLEAIRAQIETEDFKVVKIVAEEAVRALYRMPEAEFIEKAEKVVE